MTIKVPTIVEEIIAFRVIQAFAAHSYLYYELDDPVISDGEFDKLCVFIYENFEWLKPYDVNSYLGEHKRDHKAVTGFDVAKRVCGQTRDYALFLRENRLKFCQNPLDMKKASKPKTEKPRKSKPLPKDCEDLL